MVENEQKTHFEIIETAGVSQFCLMVAELRLGLINHQVS